MHGLAHRFGFGGVGFGEGITSVLHGSQLLPSTPLLQKHFPNTQVPARQTLLRQRTIHVIMAAINPSIRIVEIILMTCFCSIIFYLISLHENETHFFSWALC